MLKKQCAHTDSLRWTRPTHMNGLCRLVFGQDDYLSKTLANVAGRVLVDRLFGDGRKGRRPAVAMLVLIGKGAMP